MMDCERPWIFDRYMPEREREREREREGGREREKASLHIQLAILKDYI